MVSLSRSTPSAARPLSFKRGWFALGIFEPKNAVNIASLARDGAALGAAFVFTVGGEKAVNAAAAAGHDRHIPMLHFPNVAALRAGVRAAEFVGVEIAEGAVPLPSFLHPERAVYLLGSEGRGLTPEAIAAMDSLVVIPTRWCLNVAVAGGVVLYDRAAKMAVVA